MSSDDWHILEDKSWELAVANFSDYREMDIAVAPIIEVLRRNPLAYPVFKGMREMRMAKTKMRVEDLKVTPAMRVWYIAEAVSRTVTLRWVEAAPPSDMELNEELLAKKR